MARRYGCGSASRTEQVAHHGRPQEEDLQGQEPQPPGFGLALEAPARSICPRCGAGQAAPRRVRQLRLVRTAARPSTSTELARLTAMLPIAVDAMGGDKAPGRDRRGRAPGRRRARRPRRPGRPARRARRHRRPRGASRRPRSSPWTPTRRQACARKKDSLARARRRGGARRQGVGHGLAPATPAPPWPRALLRMGRIKGVARPAIATPIPVPGADTPTVLLDAGANAECQPEWLVQFAQMGAVFAREPLRHRRARGSACCRSARSRPRATPLVKETHELLADADWRRPAAPSSATSRAATS